MWIMRMYIYIYMRVEVRLGAVTSHSGFSITLAHSRACRNAAMIGIRSRWLYEPQGSHLGMRTLLTALRSLLSDLQLQ